MLILAMSLKNNSRRSSFIILLTLLNVGVEISFRFDITNLLYLIYIVSLCHIFYINK
ncbi:uncharacterized protein M6B38_315560 [Iris pallida]|uniref:Uncharacterized protein n=1 Tax=Iris pallida TaxID=29817 RepID=A0AAX6HG56_IRIPA|nr:uncharacterized protein M6B38_315560 [Iris pallida]